MFQSESFAKLLASTDSATATSAILSNASLVDVLRQALMYPKENTQSLSVYRCGQCNYGSHSYAELSYHARTHNESNGCGFCDYRSSSQLDRDNHTQHHAAILPYRCSHCPYLSCTLALLSEHIRLVHRTTYLLHCDSCGYETNLGPAVMTEHQATHGSIGSKLRPANSRKPSAKLLESNGLMVKKAAGCRKPSKKSSNLLPKAEPMENGASEPSSCADQTKPSVASVTPGSDEKIGQKTEQRIDRRPWWDTETQMHPPTTGVIEETSPEQRSQCASCGSWYTGDPSVHQCKVMRPKLTVCPRQCALCDFSSGDKKTLVDHYVQVHSRTWKALILRISHSYPSLDSLCGSIESLVPKKYKDTADNIWVTHAAGKSIALNAPPTDVSLYRCTKCFKSFPTPDLQAGHKLLDQCTAPYIPFQFGCVDCQVKLGTSDRGLAHHLKHHATLTVTKTENSGSDSATEDALLMLEALQRFGAEDHEVSQSPAAKPKILDGGCKIICQLCSFSTTNADKFKEHLASTHWGLHEVTEQNTLVDSSFATLYGCNFCSYIGESTGQFAAHVIHHAGEAKRTADLEIQSQDENALQTEKKMPRQVSLLMEKEPSTENKRMCDDLNSKARIKPHAARRSKTNLTCELCSFNTVHPSTLTIHMRSHTGYRPFVCSMCGKTFTTNSELRKHERRHAGLVERKYACDVCGKAYSNHQHLKVHMRAHTGDRPFKCSHCPFAATSKCVLVNHTATHTGEKNYKCHLCDFTCASSGTLSNHRRLKHNIINKRKTLAETTPESILVAAKVAGKSRRLKPGAGASSEILPKATSRETLESGCAASVTPVFAQQQSEKVVSALAEGVSDLIPVQQEPALTDFVHDGADVKSGNDVKADRLQRELDEQLPVYHIIQTGSSDYQMVGEVQSIPSKPAN